MSEKLFDVWQIARGGKAEAIHKNMPQQEAESAALDYTDRFGERYKYQVRPSKEINKDWREREIGRFKHAIYIPVPWADCPWVKKNEKCAEHFVHVAQGDSSQVAFTENADKGAIDKQMRMAPSKYLDRFYAGIISEPTIRKWCAEYRKTHGGDYELKFATTADDIVRVYEEGPDSCMKGIDRVRAYEGPDLAVAYIERKGRIVARTVAWPDKKLYCYCMYGDTELISAVLREEGFKESSHFKGARFKAIWESKRRYPQACPVLPSIEFARHGLAYGEEFVTVN